MNTLPNIKYEDGNLDNKLFKKETGRTKSYVFNPERETYAKALNDSTTYLRVHNFDKELQRELDSIYQSVDSLLTSNPYLIIDVRDNGGGSTNNAFPLVKYFYDNPIVNSTVDMYVTKNNINHLDSIHQRLIEEQVDQDSNEYFVAIANELDLLKQASLGSFVANPRSGGTIRLSNTLDAPLKVAVLYNRNCASTCEGFVYWAKQSDKAILIGENSSGTIGYGNVNRDTKTPCYGFQVGYTRIRFNDFVKYEGIGIPPAVYLNDSTDWVDQTLEVLSQ